MNVVLKLLSLLAPLVPEGVRAIARAIRKGRQKRRDKEEQETPDDTAAPPNSPES